MRQFICTAYHLKENDMRKCISFAASPIGAARNAIESCYGVSRKDAPAEFEDALTGKHTFIFNDVFMAEVK